MDATAVCLNIYSNHKNKQTMKKSILVLILALMSCASVYAYEYCDTIHRAAFTKKLYMAVVEKWADYNGRALFNIRFTKNDKETGEMVAVVESLNLFKKAAEEDRDEFSVYCPLVVSAGVYNTQMKTVFTFSCSDEYCIVKMTEATCAFVEASKTKLETLADNDMLFVQARSEMLKLIDYSVKYGFRLDCFDERIMRRQKKLLAEFNQLNKAVEKAKTKKRKDYANKKLTEFIVDEGFEIPICHTITMAPGAVWYTLIQGQGGLSEITRIFRIDTAY